MNFTKIESNYDPRAGFTLPTYGLAQRAKAWIAIVGPDGCGKDTLIDRIDEVFDINIGSGGYTIIRYPGGTPDNERLRRSLSEGDITKFSALEESYVFAANRGNLYREIIEPALESTSWVISNRWFPCALSYQGAGRNLGAKKINAINKIMCHSIPEPDCTFVLAIDTKVSYERVLRRSQETSQPLSRFEKLGLDFQARVMRSYLEQAKARPDRYVVIDAMQTKESVFAQVMSHLNNMLESGAITIDHSLPDLSMCTADMPDRIPMYVRDNSIPGAGYIYS